MGNTPSEPASTDPKKLKFGSIYDPEKVRPGYYVSKDQVIYNGTPMEFAPNEEGFEKLGYGYAKTNMNVYYKGKVVQGANPNTFSTLIRTDKEIKKHPNLLKLNSVLGTDFVDNQKRFYHKGSLLHC